MREGRPLINHENNKLSIHQGHHKLWVVKHALGHPSLGRSFMVQHGQSQMHWLLYNLNEDPAETRPLPLVSKNSTARTWATSLYVRLDAWLRANVILLNRTSLKNFDLPSLHRRRNISEVTPTAVTFSRGAHGN